MLIIRRLLGHCKGSYLQWGLQERGGPQAVPVGEDRARPADRKLAGRVRPRLQDPSQKEVCDDGVQTLSGRVQVLGHAEQDREVHT